MMPILEALSSGALWYFRGFKYARKVHDEVKVDKAAEYETKLKNLMAESRLTAYQ